MTVFFFIIPIYYPTMTNAHNTQHIVSAYSEDLCAKNYHKFVIIFHILSDAEQIGI